MANKTFTLCILDGWGYSQESSSNAIVSAHTPFFDYALSHYPSSLLETSGSAVGLPTGQMGNSESGHITIGTGQIIKQDLVRINEAIAENSLASNIKLKETIKVLKNNGRPCHVMGMISDGGVHSHISHLISIVVELKKNSIPVIIHAITDGRDVSPRSAKEFLKLLKDSDIEITTLSGRYYAMDRDNRWERTKKYYDAIVSANAPEFDDVFDVIDSSYVNGINDEFIVPTIKHGYKGFNQDDGLICINFRPDRIRQILQSLLKLHFTGFERTAIPVLSSSLCMASCSKELDDLMPPLFPAKEVKVSLGSVISGMGWKQLRLAETEKYAHVTYFFNGGIDIQHPLEERVIVSSPKIASYDLKPEMSAFEVKDKLIHAIESGVYKFICVNFANADMVGHTGNFEAAKKACEAIDKCLAEIYPVLKKHGAEMLITADHGNAEQMFNQLADQPLTSHTTNKVPLIYVGNQQVQLENGGLSDIAPTILSLIGLDIPKEMMGTDLTSQICKKK